MTNNLRESVLQIQQAERHMRRWAKSNRTKVVLTFATGEYLYWYVQHYRIKFSGVVFLDKDLPKSGIHGTLYEQGYIKRQLMGGSSVSYKKYKKKPIVVEAMQYTGDNCIACLHFMGGPYADNPELHTTDSPVVHTLEGVMTAAAGDFIIKGVNGEFYPCKPDIFEKSYEEVL